MGANPNAIRKKLVEYKTWLKKRDQNVFWDAIRKLEQAGCDFNVLASLAFNYWLWTPQKLQDKLQEVTGYSEKELRNRASKLQKLSRHIETLNDQVFARHITFLELVRLYGDNGFVPFGDEGLARQFEQLPMVMTRYAAFLKNWPHPAYRRAFSDRNSAKAYRVAQLCTYISLVVRSPYVAIENLLESMRLFLKSKPGPDAEAVAESELYAEAIKKQFEGTRYTLHSGSHNRLRFTNSEGEIKPC
jgi:hypothetical protein